jgi:hypothetical protein
MGDREIIKIKNESLEDLKDQQEVLISNLIDSEARYLEGQSFGKHDNDRLERIKNTIRVFSTLIRRGAEVQPSLMAPESVQNLFPDFSKPLSIESKIPLLRGPSKEKINNSILGLCTVIRRSRNSELCCRH